MVILNERNNRWLVKWAEEGAKGASADYWGAIVAAPGYTDPLQFGAGGNPYGTSVTVDQEAKMIEDVQAAVKHQAKRTVSVAEWVKKSNQ
jgi:NAD(P)H dehydrogenase (quinone)